MIRWILGSPLVLMSYCFYGLWRAPDCQTAAVLTFLCFLAATFFIVAFMLWTAYLDRVPPAELQDWEGIGFSVT